MENKTKKPFERRVVWKSVPSEADSQVFRSNLYPILVDIVRGWKKCSNSRRGLDWLILDSYSSGIFINSDDDHESIYIHPYNNCSFKLETRADDPKREIANALMDAILEMSDMFREE